MSDALFNFGVAGLFVGGQSPLSPSFEALTLVPINGVQSSTITLTYPRQDTQDWAGGGEPLLVQRPRANLEFSYVYVSGFNEPNLGFVTNGIVPALLSLTQAEQNYYVLIDQDHQDLVGYAGTNLTTMAFGNGALTHYTFNAGVGQLSTVSVTVEALNLLIQSSGSGVLPSVYKQSGTYPTGTYTLPPFTQPAASYFEAMPSAITLSFDSGSAVGAALSGNNACPLQTFSFSVDVPRTDVDNLGWAYPVGRPVRWPVVVSIRADAYLNGLQLDALNRLGCPDSGHSFTVAFSPSCAGPADPFVFQFQGAKLDTETISLSTSNGSARLTLNWSLHIYDVNRASGAQLFMGSLAGDTAYTGIVFPQVAYTGAMYPLVLNLGTGCYLTVVSGPGFLSGNSLFVTDQSAQVIVQANVSGALYDYQDITLSVGP